MQVTPLWYHKTLGAYDKFDFWVWCYLIIKMMSDWSAPSSSFWMLVETWMLTCRCLYLGLLQAFSFTLQYWWPNAFIPPYVSLCFLKRSELSDLYTSLWQVWPLNVSDEMLVSLLYLLSCWWKQYLCATWKASSMFGRLSSWPYGKHPAVLLQNMGTVSNKCPLNLGIVFQCHLYMLYKDNLNSMQRNKWKCWIRAWRTVPAKRQEGDQGSSKLSCVYGHGILTCNIWSGRKHSVTTWGSLSLLPLPHLLMCFVDSVPICALLLQKRPFHVSICQQEQVKGLADMHNGGLSRGLSFLGFFPTPCRSTGWSSGSAVSLCWMQTFVWWQFGEDCCKDGTTTCAFLLCSEVLVKYIGTTNPPRVWEIIIKWTCLSYWILDSFGFVFFKNWNCSVSL